MFVMKKHQKTHDFDYVNGNVTSPIFYYLTRVTKLRFYNLNNKFLPNMFQTLGSLVKTPENISQRKHF